MRKHWTLSLVVALVLALAIGIAAWSGAGKDDDQVSLDQVPPAVKATILKAAEGGTITEIEREEEDGQVIYEADIVIDGQEFEIEVAADGTLLSKEVEGDEDEEDDDEGAVDDDDDEELVALEDLPAAVKDTILKAAGDGTIVEIERETEDGQVVYEADVIIDGQEFEIEVAADGTLLSKELDDDGDDDTEDDD